MARAEHDVADNADLNLADAIAMILGFARSIDLAWNQARRNGAPPGLVMAFGQASHGLHRALIAFADAGYAPETVPGAGSEATRE